MYHKFSTWYVSQCNLTSLFASAYTHTNIRHCLGRILYSQLHAHIPWRKHTHTQIHEEGNTKLLPTENLACSSIYFRFAECTRSTLEMCHEWEKRKKKKNNSETIVSIDRPNYEIYSIVAQCHLMRKRNTIELFLFRFFFGANKRDRRLFFFTSNRIWKMFWHHSIVLCHQRVRQMWANQLYISSSLNTPEWHFELVEQIAKQRTPNS